MTVIVCLDDNKGMMFNNRRQSRDRVLVSDLISTAAGNPIYIKEYSKTLFSGDNLYSEIKVCNNPFEDCSCDDIYFNETDSMLSCEDSVEKVIVYNWNRSYPSDLKFELDLDSYTLVNSEAIKGSSHEKIIKEVYIR